MTKVRPPVSFERAIANIAAVIGWDGCASVLGKSESYARKLSDPDIEREICIRDARRLDQAYLRAGGGGTPMLDAYAFQLDLSRSEEVSPIETIIAAIGATAKEYGEAAAAALAAVQRGACAPSRTAALREIEEAVESLMALARGLGASSIIDGG